MSSRFNAASKFWMDAFAISLIAVILTDEALHPVLLFWPILSFAAALSAFLLLGRLRYSVWLAAAIAGTAALSGVLIGFPLWLAAALMLAAIYRLHARFSGSEDGDEALSKPMLLIVALFAIALFTTIFNPGQETEQILYTLFAAAIVLNVLLSLGYRYLKLRSEGIAGTQLAATGGFVLVASGLLALLVYGIAENARQGAGAAAGWLLHLVLWPFSGLMEKLGGSLSALSNSEKAQQTIDKMGPSETGDKSELASVPAAADFPVEVMLGALLLGITAALVLWLKKWRPEKAALQKEQPITIERMGLNSAKPAASETYEEKTRAEPVDLQFIRSVYRDFERHAEAAGHGRSASETVREWTSRMGWQVSERFFATYEFVRYGQGEVSPNEAYPFLEEIEQLSEKNFIEKV